MPKPYVIRLDGEAGAATLRGTPLRLSAYEDEVAARAAIGWQGEGGWPSSEYAIAYPDESLPAVMRTHDGRAVLIKNIFWTDQAFATFIINVWG